MSYSTIQGDFTLERTFAAPVTKVFTAFADKQAKEKWFKGPSAKAGEHTMDFVVGGRESSSGTFGDDIRHRFEATYYDIVPNERIIYAYEMYLNDNRISVSLTTIMFEVIDGQTKLTLHEDGVFLDNYDTVQSRERGTRDLLEAVAISLV